MESLGGKYTFIRCIGQCGESAIYWGVHTETDEKVIIHEYFPPHIAHRVPNTDIIIAADNCAVVFKSLLEDFIELGMLLKDLKNRYATAECLDVIRQNQTAYIVYAAPDAPTFEDFLARLNGAVGWTTLKRMMAPIITALSALHAKGYYHRGISPTSLLITQEQTLLLTCFCIPAARTAQSEMEASFCFGYSAPEQHTAASWQGAWTDVYALAATCYRALTGVSVVDCNQKNSNLSMLAPAQYNPDIPPYVSDAIMKALSIEPLDRFHTIDEFWRSVTNDVGSTMIFAAQAPEESLSTAKNTRRTLDFILPIALIVIVISLSFISYHIIVTDMFYDPSIEPVASSYPLQIVEPLPEPSSSTIESPIEQIPWFTERYIETVLSSDKYIEKFDFQLEWVYSEEHTYGTIISQFPASYTPIVGRKIKLTISKGTEFTVMPDIIGMNEEAAAQLLRTLDIPFVLFDMLDLDAEENSIVSANKEAGEVISKDYDVLILYTASRSLA